MSGRFAGQSAPQARGGGILGTIALVLGLISFVPVVGLGAGLGAIVLGIAALPGCRYGRTAAMNGIRGAVVGILSVQCLGVGLLAPTLGQLRWTSRRYLCQENLKNIGMGMAMYAADNSDEFPILPDIDQKKAVAYAADLKMGADCLAKDLGTGAQQNLCLLVKSGAVPFKMFLCPGVGRKEAAQRDASSRFGLGLLAGRVRTTYCDYAIQIPYAKTPEGENKCPLKADMDAGVAVLGDQGPEKDFLTNWSPNHGNEENLLFAGLSTRFSQDARKVGQIESKNTGGWGGNNIYTADVWEEGPERVPKLKAFGSGNTTPTDKLAVYDSVLYGWFVPRPTASVSAPASSQSSTGPASVLS